MKRMYIISGLALLVVGVALLAALLVPSLGLSPARTGMRGDMERQFIEEMIPHHEDAVAMAELARNGAEHGELGRLAEAIIVGQSREIVQMRSWYRSWYGVEPPESGSGMGTGIWGGRRGRMGMDMMGGSADLEALEAAQPFDREFIRQMIPHHQMGVMMARMVLGGTNRPEIQELARSIIRTQSAEIRQMQAWYRAWYGR